MHKYWRRAIAPALALAVLGGAVSTACGGDDEQSLTVYSGRSESLIGPLLEQFSEDSGIDVEVRYGSTTEMATTLLEEGSNSPADVFIAQDTGGLGAIQNAGLFEVLPNDILDRVDARWRSDDGGWVGLSGRSRVVVYNPGNVDAAELPASIFELTGEAYRDRVAWAPTNASFQAFVTAMRLQHGEDTARQWLEGMIANGTTAYGNNTAIVEAVAAGEVDFGLVNHYYLHQLRKEHGDSFAAENHYTEPGDTGTLVGVAGAGILASSDNQDAGRELIEFLLSDEAQTYFAENTSEYPVTASVEPRADLPSLNEIQPPAIDLDNLEDLEGTLALLRSVGALE